jgi:hypothetical protein
LLPLGAAVVGTYAVAATFAGVLQPLFLSMNVRIFRSQKEIPLRGLIRVSMGMATVGALVGAVAYIVVEPVFGSAYAEAAAPAFWLSLGSGGNGTFLVVRGLLERSGRPELSSAIQVGFLVLVAATLGATVALGFGLLGVSVMTVPLQFVRAVAAVHICRRVGAVTVPASTEYD